MEKIFAYQEILEEVQNEISIQEKMLEDNPFDESLVYESLCEGAINSLKSIERVIKIRISYEKKILDRHINELKGGEK